MLLRGSCIFEAICYKRNNRCEDVYQKVQCAHDTVAHHRFQQRESKAERLASAAPRSALTGCPWHDVKTMLRDVGLRPTRQRMALGWILFGKGDRHITAEMLYEEATKAKVPVSLATVYNTLHQFTDVGLLRQVAVDGSKTYFDTNVSQHHHFFVEGENDLLDIPKPTWSSARRRCRPKAMRSRASTWWCGCAARAAERSILACECAGSRARRAVALMTSETAHS